jgi:uncharacterized membrane protein
MRRSLVLPLIATCVLAALTVATAYVGVPQFVRIVLGLLIVFLLPGFAVVCAVPPNQLSADEFLFASLGISLALATCTAVLLAAVPIGLSRESFAVSLGSATFLVAACAAANLQLRRGPRRASSSRAVRP